MKRLAVVVFVICFSSLLLAQADKAGTPAKSKIGTAKATSHKEAKIISAEAGSASAAPR